MPPGLDPTPLTLAEIREQVEELRLEGARVRAECRRAAAAVRAAVRLARAARSTADSPFLWPSGMRVR